MKTKTLVLLFALPLIFASCGGGETKVDDNETTSQEEVANSEEESDEAYDETVGIGKYNSENYNPQGLDAELAKKGKSISETKCFSCHKITSEKLVGPGWEGVTKRRTLHWILNFITNPDPMIDKDPEVQAQLEECLVRMPNQNLEDTDAKGIVEYMRQNDGAK
jgi:cytochrome c5